jgi:hypothetical protein
LLGYDISHTKQEKERKTGGEGVTERGVCFLFGILWCGVRCISVSSEFTLFFLSVTSIGIREREGVFAAKTVCTEGGGSRYEKTRNGETERLLHIQVQRSTMLRARVGIHI